MPPMSLFHVGRRGSRKKHLVTFEELRNVTTISLGEVGVKVNLDNVTKYEVFFEGFP